MIEGHRQSFPVSAQRPECAIHVAQACAPLPPDIGVLAVDVHVRIQGSRTCVGVVSGDHIGAAVTKKGQTFRDRRRLARDFYRHVLPSGHV